MMGYFIAGMLIVAGHGITACVVSVAAAIAVSAVVPDRTNNTEVLVCYLVGVSVWVVVSALATSMQKTIFLRLKKLLLRFSRCFPEPEVQNPR